MLVQITSAGNSRTKLVRKLQTKKGRIEEGRFVAEGRNLITEILERGLDVDFIMVPASLLSESLSGTADLIASCIDSPDITLCAVSDREFEKLTDACEGVGMLAVVRMKECGPETVRDLPPDANILILDRIQDPGNLGTIVRTAAAAGYGAVLAMSGTADLWSPKVLRSTAGMVFAIPFIAVKDHEELRELAAGRRLVVTSVEGGRPYYEENLREGIALVIGNERWGVSPEIMEMADVRVTLPMKGGVESLNAAMAAAILMYESVRL